MAEFAHLHSHTDHSPLDGHAEAEKLARHIASMGQPGFAITDHGTQSNVYNGYMAAKKISDELGKKFYFLPGIEAYVTPGDLPRDTHAPVFFGNGNNDDKTENSKDVAGGGAYTHLTMLSYNNEGMHNLFKLNSLAWLDGQYRKPRMDINIISQYSKGIIATTGCPSGELQTRIRLGQIDEAIKYAGKMQDIFGKENYFLELMDHDMKINLEREVRNDLMMIAKKLDIPLLATNDLHYVHREDAPDHEHMLALQSGHTMHEPSYNNGGKRFAFEGEEYYAKSTEEMLQLFPEDTFPGAIQNSAEIVKRSEVTFEYNDTLRPSVPLPEGHDEHTFLREKVMEGLYKKRPTRVHDKEYLDRIEVELDVLKNKNFSGYMLVVADFIVWAKENGILVGPGRGCLSGDTEIPTTKGIKKIRDIQVGDIVFDQNGNQVEVPRVWEWECNETLVSINAPSAGAPVKMTKDHKVLASLKEDEAPYWMRADELSNKHFVVMPKNMAYPHSNSQGKFAYHQVESVEEVNSEGKVYDFRVDTTMSYATSSFVVHNSGGGSLVAYLTSITEIDPIEHGLIFERFLNPERDSPPDIDTDFPDIDREKVIEYVRNKYGNDQIAMIITFGLIKSKSALKDIIKILGEPYNLGDMLTKTMPPPAAGREISLKEAFDPNAKRYPEAEEFRKAANSLENKSIIPSALGVEGKLRQTGVHAAGVIMSSKPIIDSIPLLMRKSDGAVITQFDYPTCEALGLIKMDFLGLRNLTVIQKSIDAIERNHGIKLNPNEIYDSALRNPDKKALEMISSGKTLGIFQLDSPGIASLAKYMNVDRFEDISAILAFYRPGPMGVNAHLEYADRKNKRKPIVPIHPDLEEVLEPILGETYGLIAFQEQIQFIAQKVAGYSLGQADILRRAMGKKKKSILDAEFIPFSEGMRKNGYKDEAINELWKTLIPFAEYGFNKCLHGRTRVVLENGRTATIEDLYKEFDSGNPVKILSMFEDGEIKPHLVKDVVKSGLKPIWTIRTKAGRMIKLTEDHRLLTIQGYGTIANGGLTIGQELIVESEKKTFHISEEDRMRRKNSISSLNKTDKSRESSRQRMAQYQSTLTFEDRSKHQKRVQMLNPNRNSKGQPLAIAKLQDLWSNDKEWQKKALSSMRKVKRELYDTGKGFGRTTLLSDGRIADSMVEALAAEYLISRGIEFEMHKQFESTTGKIRETDFYAEGVYFEMDGLGRGKEWFKENKYGNEIPFVYLTPFNYIDEIDSAIMRHGIENGDEIVEIIPPKKTKKDVFYQEMTYDIEMDSSGPANFIANGIVSHNSHSAAYGLISYITAYLKANYAPEFMAANLSTLTGDKEKTATYLAECRHMDIEVLPPDISRSTADYTATKEGTILFGLEAIRGVGTDVANRISQEAMENGEFKDIPDFLNRAPSNALTKLAIENLIHAGAFDSFGHTRKSLFYSLPENVKSFSQVKKKEEIGQFDLFAMLDDPDDKPTIEILDLPEYTKKDKLRYERHTLGLYVSDHPLSGIANMLERFSDTQAVDVFSHKIRPSTSFGDRVTVRFAGVASNVVRKATRAGGMIGLFDLEDISGVMPCIIFPKSFERLGGLVHDDGIYEISGSLLGGDSEDDVKLAVDSIKEIELTESGLIPFNIQLGLSQTSDVAITELQKILLKYPGQMPVHLRVYKDDKSSILYELSDDLRVAYSKDLANDIRMLFGVRSVL